MPVGTPGWCRFERLLVDAAADFFLATGHGVDGCGELFPGYRLGGAELLGTVFAYEDDGKLAGGNAEALTRSGLFGGREDGFRAGAQQDGDEFPVFCGIAVGVKQTELFPGAAIVGGGREDEQHTCVMAKRVKCGLSVCGEGCCEEGNGDCGSKAMHNVYEMHERMWK